MEKLYFGAKAPEQFLAENSSWFYWWLSLLHPGPAAKPLDLLRLPVLLLFPTHPPSLRNMCVRWN